MSANSAVRRIPMPDIGVGKVLGAIVWVIAAYATALIFQELGMTEWPLVGATIVAQSICTYLEGKLWRGSLNAATIVALIFDVLANASGVWIFVLRIENTGIWRMIQDITGWQSIQMSWHLGIAILVALALAVAPEALWRDR